MYRTRFIFLLLPQDPKGTRAPISAQAAVVIKKALLPTRSSSATAWHKHKPKLLEYVSSTQMSDIIQAILEEKSTWDDFDKFCLGKTKVSLFQLNRGSLKLQELPLFVDKRELLCNLLNGSPCFQVVPS